MNTDQATTTTPAAKPTPKGNGSAKTKVIAKKEPNVVTLADLCKEAKVEPKVARVRLRASKLKKNAGSWEWQKGSATLKEVRKVDHCCRMT